MKILVVGSGGREHAICHAFSRSGRVAKIYCADGNAGIAEIAECVPIKPDDIAAVAAFAESERIDLTFVGGEVSLALGMVDEFERRGLKIVGASKAAARLEASKSFAKDFMARHSIPTAKFETAASPAEAIQILEDGALGGPFAPVVVKADGLAAGKGVVVATDRAEAVGAIMQLETLAGKSAAEKIVLEECLMGREVSLLMFADGENFALMPPTRDHKRIGEGDTGPNTGGMGTITDASLLSDEQTTTIIEKIIKPTLAGCAKEGFPFRGILFLGLMMTESVGSGQKAGGSEERLYPPTAAANRQLGRPMLLEYNVRFGDPETQAILVRLETDLVDICEALLNGNLADLNIRWRDGSSTCVVLASEGYPSKSRTGDVIHGLNTARQRENVNVFHAGTARDPNGDIVTSGGRVLGVTAVGDNLEFALATAYAAVGDISWDGMQYRRDIGSD